jgi:glucosamine--fructose-6-phosphate aminotransferase (isomerizing)
MSMMAETMASQPDELRRMLAEDGGIAAAAERLRPARRVIVVGTGTSWHAANQGAALLRLAGLEAWAVQGADAAAGDPGLRDGDALLLLTHRGTKRRTAEVLAGARARGIATVVVSRRGNPDADLETVENERSAAFTASNLAALMRVAQLARELGADLPGLEGVPGAVAAELAAGPAGVEPPRRLLEFAGAGINQWTAAEGALKIAETALVASEGLSVEGVLHGPAVALGADDALVCLDGGSESDRLAELERVIAAHGARTHRFTRTDLGVPLSIFPLTVVVQKIALEAAETLGTDPDTFGRTLPGRGEAWSQIQL